MFLGDTLNSNRRGESLNGGHAFHAFIDYYFFFVWSELTVRVVQRGNTHEVEQRARYLSTSHTQKRDQMVTSTQSSFKPLCFSRLYLAARDRINSQLAKRGNSLSVASSIVTISQSSRDYQVSRAKQQATVIKRENCKGFFFSLLSFNRRAHTHTHNWIALHTRNP